MHANCKAHLDTSDGICAIKIPCHFASVIKNTRGQISKRGPLFGLPYWSTEGREVGSLQVFQVASTFPESERNIVNHGKYHCGNSVGGRPPTDRWTYQFPNGGAFLLRKCLSRDVYREMWSIAARKEGGRVKTHVINSHFVKPILGNEGN